MDLASEKGGYPTARGAGLPQFNKDICQQQQHTNTVKAKKGPSVLTLQVLLRVLFKLLSSGGCR